MGLFTQRPEENEEWAGLPSEPVRDETTAERLTDASSLETAGLGLFLGASSVVIPLAHVQEQSDEAPDGVD